MNEIAGNVIVAKIANPYDFANPVSSKDLFVGRADELRDIKYYLDHAKKSDRSINLALLGDRAAGKTSLLNIVELEASDRGLIPVRVDLNESDVDSHFAFWFKLFDAIFNRLVSEPSKNGDGHAFGGTHGRTYDTYLDLITAYDVPDDKTFCPFQFPIQYAKAMGAGNANARVSDQILKRDLNTMSQEAGRPIVLLIDECNVLSSQRALLEMVRNMFMNLPGYMLVFTGTPDLFPLMDEVFSPIIRQFKRIEVAPFVDILETRRGVVRPLKAVGCEGLYPMPDEEFFESVPTSARRFVNGDLHDLHALTGGRPYEIQLVCHFMFRRVQWGTDKHMRLSFDVLEDVLRELRQSHDVDARPIISAVKQLELDGLRCLQVLLRSDGRVPIEQLMFSFITTGRTDRPAEAIRETLALCVDKGVLAEVSNGVQFRGDDFDRIVCKYAARQRGVNLSFECVSVAEVFESQILRSLSEPERTKETSRRKRVRGICLLFSEDSDSTERTRVFQTHWPRIKEGDSVVDVCRECNEIASEAYWHLGVSEEWLSVGSTLVRIHACGAGAEYTGFLCRVHNESNEDAFANCIKALETMRDSAGKCGGLVEWEVKELCGASSEELFDALVSVGDDTLLKRCISFHASEAYVNYVNKKNSDCARWHALRTARHVRLIEDDAANNVGYMLMSLGEPEKAVRVFEELLARNPEYLLGRYNCAVALLLQSVVGGVVQQSIVDEARDQLMKVTQSDPSELRTDIGVLLVPQIVDGAVSVQESWAETMEEESGASHLSLGDAARTATDVCDQLCKR